MQKSIVFELEDLYMMVERVREGKRVNGGEGVVVNILIFIASFVICFLFQVWCTLQALNYVPLFN